jgi:hypothetical protein
MFTITLRSITIACLVTVAWVAGAYQLFDLLVNFETQWYWYPLALLYTVTINEYFGHLCCGHDTFKIDTNRITYKILAFLNCVDHAWSPPSSMSLIHHNHHMYADQGIQDFSNAKMQTWYRIGILSPIHYIYHWADWEIPDSKNYFARQHAVFKHILDDPWTQFCEKNSHWLAICYWAVLYMIFPVFLLKVVLIGRVLISVYTLFPGLLGHIKIPGGYRNFNTNDNSYNNLIFHYLCLCIFPTVLHNNHHGMKYTFEQGHRYRFFEFDLSVYPMRLIRFLIKKTA